MQNSTEIRSNILRMGANALWHGFLRVYYNYDDKALESIAKIRNSYHEYCRTYEENHASSTLESKSDGKMEEWPKFFQMKEKQPVVIDLNFAPNDNQRTFIIEVRQAQSKIQTEIEQIISMICSYQEQRISRLFIGKGYSYDPINLFFEEFKMWLVNLAYAKLDKPTLDVVIQRKLYLENLIDKRVFDIHERPILESLSEQLSKTGLSININQFSAMELIIQVTEYLEVNLIPKINLILDKQRAREYFEALAYESEQILTDGLEYLFHALRNTLNTTKNININAIRNPQQDIDQKCINSTLSGQLLRLLTFTPEFLLVFPISEKKEQIVNINTMSEEKNIFLGKSQTPKYPTALSASFKNKTIDRYNWFNPTVHKQESGILAVFRTQTLMDHYLIALGLLQKIALLHLIADQFADLAGEGGEILVFGYLLEQVQTMIDNYQKTLSKLDEIIEIFKKTTQKYQINLVKKEKLISPEDQSWLDKRERTSNKYNDIKKSISKSFNYLRNIMIRIEIVHDKNYFKNLQTKIDSLNLLIMRFCDGQYPKIAHVNKLTTTSNVLINPTKADCLDTDHVINFENKTIKIKNIQRNSDSGFLALGINREEIIENLIENKNNYQLRTLVAPEIIFMVFSGNFIDEAILQSINPSKIALENGIKFMEALGFQIPEDRTRNFINFIQWVEETKVQDNTILIIKKNLEETQKRLYKYATEEKTYCDYLNDYYLEKRKPLALIPQETGAVHAIAHFLQKNIYVWQFVTDGQIQLFNQYGNVEDINTKFEDCLHILYRTEHQETFFDQLVFPTLGSYSHKDISASKQTFFISSAKSQKNVNASCQENFSLL